MTQLASLPRQIVVLWSGALFRITEGCFSLKKVSEEWNATWPYFHGRSNWTLRTSFPISQPLARSNLLYRIAWFRHCGSLLRQLRQEPCLVPLLGCSSQDSISTCVLWCNLHTLPMLMCRRQSCISLKTEMNRSSWNTIYLGSEREMQW